MEHIPEKKYPNIRFKNEPKLSGYEVDKKIDERRALLVPHIQEFVANDELFKGKEVTIEFSHSGVSSLMTFIEAGGEKWALKIPLHNGTGASDEALFLKKWEQAEVKVPHVFREGKIADRPYFLMEFVDAPLLTDAIRSGAVDDDISIEMGRTLAKMHTARAEGFGQIIDGQPEFSTFKEWITSKGLKKRFDVVQGNNLLGDEHGKLDDVINTLTTYVEKDGTSTYCHFDFGANNILATKPITIIDPDPMLNNAIIDIGRSILLEISGGHTGERLKLGYTSEGKQLDPKALQASIILNAYWKFPYWHKKEKTKQIERVQKYLVETKHLL